MKIDTVCRTFVSCCIILSTMTTMLYLFLFTLLQILLSLTRKWSLTFALFLSLFLLSVSVHIESHKGWVNSFIYQGLHITSLCNDSPVVQYTQSSELHYEWNYKTNQLGCWTETMPSWKKGLRVFFPQEVPTFSMGWVGVVQLQHSSTLHLCSIPWTLHFNLWLFNSCRYKIKLANWPFCLVQMLIVGPNVAIVNKGRDWHNHDAMWT